MAGTTQKLLTGLLTNDARLIRRDGFLIMMAAVLAVIAIVLRYLLPWADTYLAEAGLLPNAYVANSLSAYYPVIVSYMTLFDGALITGAIFGFVLLDEKDGHTLQALMVTPVRLRSYVGYRVVLPSLLTAIVVPIQILVIDQAVVGGLSLVLFGIGAGLATPLIVLFYAIAAENKVQGFAMAKFVGLGGVLILIGFFVPEPWQWGLALFPPFLVHKAYWLALEGTAGWLILWGIGVVWQIIVALAMIRLFEKRMHR